MPEFEITPSDDSGPAIEMGGTSPAGGPVLEASAGEGGDHEFEMEAGS